MSMAHPIEIVDTLSYHRLRWHPYHAGWIYARNVLSLLPRKTPTQKGRQQAGQVKIHNYPKQWPAYSTLTWIYAPTLVQNESMKTAQDLMTSQVYSINSSDELDTVIRDFLQYGVTTAPVLDHMGDVLGILSELSLVKIFVRQSLKESKVVRIGQFSDILEEPFFVSLDTPIAGVMKSLVHSPTHRVIVQNLGKQMVGVISPKDVLRFLLGEFDESKNLSSQLEKAHEKLKEVMSQLKDAKEVLIRYQNFYEKTPVLMHSVDMEGNIVMANQCIHQALGYNPGELIGKHIDDLYSKDHVADAYRGLKNIANKGFHNSTYTTMLTKEGTPFRVDVASAAINTPNGDFFATISVSRPINSDTILRALRGLLHQESLGEEDLNAFLQEIQAMGLSHSQKSPSKI